MLDLRASVGLFKQTKFRLVKKGRRAQGQRSQSTIEDVSKFMAKKEVREFMGLDDLDSPTLGDVGKSSSDALNMKGNFGLETKGAIDKMKRKSSKEAADAGEAKLKYTFRPID